MSITAQRRDISDPHVISTFAEQVETIERLDYLYLLTISDIRATNPKQWNDWKGKLLAELYNKAASVLNRGLQHYTDKEANILEIQTASLRRLALKGIDSHQANELWQTLNAEYFQSHTYGQITWHTLSIIEARQNDALDKPLVKTRVHESSNSIQLLIYMKDRDGIFHDVVTALGISEVDIVNAQVINASDGYALQSFRLAPINTNNVEMSLVAEQIIHLLEDRLSNTRKSAETIISNNSRRYKYFSSPTVITYKEANHGNATRLKIETIDRTGVLANIAKTLSDCDLRLLNARITTAGEMAIDFFVISTKQDQALSEEQKETLQQKLKEIL
jgi:[protein-PII] uridylyltransferase